MNEGMYLFRGTSLYFWGYISLEVIAVVIIEILFILVFCYLYPRVGFYVK